LLFAPSSAQETLAAATVSETPETDEALVDHMPKDATEWSEYYLALSIHARKLERERDAARVPICIGRPIIEILAKEGMWTSMNGNSVVAADCLFGRNPYQESTCKTTKNDRYTYPARRSDGCPLCRQLTIIYRNGHHVCTDRACSWCEWCGGKCEMFTASGCKGPEGDDGESPNAG
jgi:hypothetical protein